MSSGPLRNYKYLLSLLPGIVVIFGNVMGGWWGVSNILFSLGVLGIVEWLSPEDKRNEGDYESTLPDIILLLHVPLQIAALVTLFGSIQSDRFTFSQLILAAISTGINSGSSSIVISHEMIHRKNLIWQQLGKFLLFSAGNIYFFVEHLRVHHKWVGTEHDPATARLNESVYHFFFRSTIGQIQGAVKLEKQRLKGAGRFSRVFRNYVFRNLLLQLIVCVVLFYSISLSAMIAYIIQSHIANFLLEYTNYIEHYGLNRKDNERVTASLSWQSDKVISRFFLIDLSRHSDHHYYASKPFHTLDSLNDSPVLPTGYVTGIYLALIPKLWFRVVNKRIRIP